ncbi:MAG: YfcC family protein [Candidatus Sacchiramonaceae bacterium]|nr:YfcC family protein [Candidatus Saccharimonadaceae bacterium]
MDTPESNTKPVVKSTTKMKSKRKFKMPSAFSILFGIVAIVALLTWMIPSGQYELDIDGQPIAGTYHQTEKIQEIEAEDGTIEEVDLRSGLWEVAQAPIRGTADAVDVVLFIIVIGGFLNVTMKSGALDAALGRIIKKLKGKEKWLIPILMTFFAIGGTTYGMQEETIAFYALVVPMMIAAGYNGMVAALTIILGAGVGIIGSTVNPFSTGIASGFADISMGDGVIWRLLVLVASLVFSIMFVMRYAAKVKSGEYKDDATKTNELATVSSEVPEFTGKRKAIVAVFALTFVLMVLSVIPWSAEFGITIFEDFNTWLVSLPIIGGVVGAIVPLGDWWFMELSMLFFVASIIIGVIHRNHYIDNFIDGAKDLLSVALIIGVARGVSVVMTDGQIMATIINVGEQILHAMPGFILPVVTFIVYLPLSFLIPSTSGLATATMPILAPLADFANIDRSLIVTAFATSAGVVNLFAPTVASVMGGLALAGVPYNKFLKRIWPAILMVTVISIVVLLIAVVF